MDITLKILFHSLTFSWICWKSVRWNR